MHKQKSDGKIITFYSYKGGTGRSMALANTAWVLACNGKRVLVIDWDLEAPGLHRYFYPFLDDKELTSSEGIIDFVNEFADAAMTPYAEGEEKPKDWYLPYADILRFATSLNWKFPDAGTLDFIPAGRQGTSYSSRVNSFSWQNFYERLGGGVLIEATRVQMKAEYDYILIDSRTGVSDTSGICTVQLPDILVACFTLNNQGIEGAAAVAASVFEQRTGSGLQIFPVAMRVEINEKIKSEKRKEYARDKFPLFPNNLGEEARERYWGEVPVPYIPFYAFEEILACFGDRRKETISVLAATEKLVSYLTAGEVSETTEVNEADRARVLAQYAREPVKVDPAKELVAAADKAFSRLAPAEQITARSVLTRLVRLTRPEEVGNDTLLRVNVEEFVGAGKGILDQLADARLVLIEPDGSNGSKTVKVADDALIQGWGRLQEWVKEDREFLLWRQQLKANNAEWERSDRDKGALLSGEPLSRAKRWQLERQEDLSLTESYYIIESSKAEESLSMREAERDTLRRRFSYAAGAVLFLIIVASIYTINSVWQKAAQQEREDKNRLTSLRLIGEGNESLNAGGADAAITKFEEALKFNVDSAEANIGMGKARLYKNDFDTAIEHLNRAIDLKPGSTEAHLNLASAYVGKGAYDQAIANFNSVLEINPGDADALAQRGNAYRLARKYDEALADLSRSLETKQEPQTIYFRGLVWDATGDYERAVEDYGKAINWDNNYAEAYLQRAVSYQKMNNRDAAIAGFEAAYTLSPKTDTGGAAAQFLKKLGARVPPKIYLHYQDSEDAGTLIAIARDLGDNGFDVEGRELIPESRTAGDVRYFDLQDRKAAERVRALVQSSLLKAGYRIKLEAKDLSKETNAKNASPGQIEVWLPGLFDLIIPKEQMRDVPSRPAVKR